jgi:hypothetical protein
MSMHNQRLAHDVERPCFVCRKSTKALNRGVMEAHPRCEECKTRLAEEFNQALAQQRKQDQAARPRREQPKTQ